MNDVMSDMDRVLSWHTVCYALGIQMRHTGRLLKQNSELFKAHFSVFLLMSKRLSWLTEPHPPLDSMRSFAG